MCRNKKKYIPRRVPGSGVEMLANDLADVEDTRVLAE